MISSITTALMMKVVLVCQEVLEARGLRVG